MIIKNELKKLGFNNKEALIYLAILELEEASASQISRKAEINRTTGYGIISSLKKRGLISSIKKRGKYFYYAESIKNLENELEEKKEIINRLMPEIIKISGIADKKPETRYFEGKDGMKKVFEDFLKYPDSENCYWASEKYYFFDEEYLLNHFIPKRKKKKIFSRAIAPNNKKMEEQKEKDIEQLRKTKIYPGKDLFVDSTISIYGKNKVAILSYEEKISIIIESTKIHNSLKNIFEMMWRLLPD